MFLNVMVTVSWVMVAVVLPGTAMAQGIYTCVDAKGRRITSDRHIAECTDRTQHEVSPAGVVVRVLGPTLTEREMAAQEEKDKVSAIARLREQEEQRRNRALMLRYPNRASHDKERALALAQIDDLLGASLLRMKELSTQRAGINADFEYYKKDPTKAPTALTRSRDENDRNVAEQKSYMAEQAVEKQKVNARFDEELVKLGQLWAKANAPLPGAPASIPKSPPKN